MSIFQHIKGTFDILPGTTTAAGETVPPSAAWRHVEQTVHEVMARFDFEEIRTPILEPTELVARGIGALTDIVSKEMFAFERGDTRYVMRPEVTAPVMRAYLEHHLAQRGGVQKLYYIGPCFRAEEPQRGRYRQFHQFGCEIVGSPSARADAEAIALMMAVYEAFGLRDTRLRINSLGGPDSRPRYTAALRDHLMPFADELTETSRRRLETNPLRILDTKDDRERRLLESAPTLEQFLDEESRTHHEEVCGLLDALGIDYARDPFLVRGLDYYTRTAFELESPHLGAQSALGGGGRYDLLAQELGSKQPIAAVGFACGIERLFLALEAEGVELPQPEGPDVALVALGDEAGRWAYQIAPELRRQGLRVALDLKGGSLKSQLKEANRRGARLAVLVGDQELAAGVAQVREVETFDESTVPFDDLARELVSRAASDSVPRPA